MVAASADTEACDVCSLTPSPRQTSLTELPFASSTLAFRRVLMICVSFSLAANLTSFPWRPIPQSRTVKGRPNSRPNGPIAKLAWPTGNCGSMPSKRRRARFKTPTSG